MLCGLNGSGKFYLMVGSGWLLIEWVECLVGQVKWVFVIGLCMVYGGLLVNILGNLLEVCGLQYDIDMLGGLFGVNFQLGGGLLVVNIVGCLMYLGWVVDMLEKLVLEGLSVVDFDEFGWLLFYVDQFVYYGCVCNEFYEFKVSVEKYLDFGCLMENFGCKGIQVYVDCNL